jgi:hypothetical protein
VLVSIWSASGPVSLTLWAAPSFLQGGGDGILLPWRAGARHGDNEVEHPMRQFLVGLFITLAFAAVVLAALFGIFTLVSYLAGPVGG